MDGKRSAIFRNPSGWKNTTPNRRCWYLSSKYLISSASTMISAYRFCTQYGFFRSEDARIERSLGFHLPISLSHSRAPQRVSTVVSESEATKWLGWIQNLISGSGRGESEISNADLIVEETGVQPDIIDGSWCMRTFSKQANIRIRVRDWETISQMVCDLGCFF